MKISTIPVMLKHCHEANQNVMIWGPPGIGKTTIVEQYAESMKMPLIYADAPLMDLLDLKGALSVKDDEAKFLPLTLWPKEDDDPVIVLVDELPQAVPAIQNGFSKLLLRNEMGEMVLPKGSFVVATGNRMEDRAATHRMPSHITNRVMHVNLEQNNEDWLTWALNNGIDTKILAFGRFRPELLYNFDPDKAQKPYATYRSWVALSEWLKTNPPTDLIFEGACGEVGEGAASEFSAFLRVYQDLPDPKDVLANPEKAAVPSEMSTLYALTMALASAVDKSTADNFFIFADRLPPEFSVLMVKTASAKFKGVQKSKGFTQWVMNNQKIIL